MTGATTNDERMRQAAAADCIVHLYGICSTLIHERHKSVCDVSIRKHLDDTHDSILCAIGQLRLKLPK